jgi:hypothetical protein
MEQKGAVLASLKRSRVETCAARVCVVGITQTGATGSFLASREALASVRDGGSAVVRV